MASELLTFTQINLHHCKGAADLLGCSLAMKHTMITLIQEPYVCKGKVMGLELNGYIILQDKNSPRPRACIIVSKDVKASFLPQFSNGDLVAMLVNLTEGGFSTNLVVASAYLPYESAQAPGADVEELVKFCSANGHSLLLGCDANAHHSVWGSSNINSRGESLLEFVSATKLNILNNGNEPTFFNKHRKEVIDITLCSREIEDLIRNWRVSDEVSLSDHRYINFSLSAKIRTNQWIRNPRNTNWIVFQNELTGTLGNPTVPNNTRELDEMVLSLNKNLLNAFEKACPLKRINKSKNPPWWSSEIRASRRDTRYSLRQALRTNSTEDWSKYRADQLIYKNKIRRAKRAGWRNFCEEVDGVSASAKMHKILSKDPLCKPGFLITPSGTYTKSDEETLKLLMDTHFPDNVAISTRLEQGSDLESSPRQGSGDVAGRVITRERLKWAINSFSPFKTAGQDGIIPAFLQKGLDLVIGYLEIILSKSLTWGHIPREWREVKIIFIPKPGRIDYNSAKAFRPISLSSFMLKTMERLIDRDIRDSVLIANPLSINQHAFRAGFSTESALHNLVNKIDCTLAAGESVLATFMDIQGAFDNTTFNSINGATQKRNIDHQTRAWISAMLAGRTLMADLNGISIKVLARKGCPQGSVLSPLLWLMVVDELITMLTDQGLVVQGYADDLVILICGRFINTLCSRMQEVMGQVEDWCTSTELSVNPDKTQLVLFTKKRKIEGFFNPTLFNKSLIRSHEVKYLGVTIDDKLNWGAHVALRLQKAIKSFWALRRAVGRNWGLSPKVVHWFYTAVIRPLFTYGSIIWWQRANLVTAQKSFDHLQRLACVAITGAMRTTPTKALETLLNLPTLGVFIKSEAKKAAYRLNITGQWAQRVIGGGHAQIWKNVVKENHMFNFISDKITRRFHFDKKFKTIFPTREDWSNNNVLNKFTNSDICFTDGSLADGTSGAGVYRLNPRSELSFPLGEYTTVFQAEVYAILQSIWLLKREPSGVQQICICSDSQAALKALTSYRVDSSLVWLCLEELTSLSTHKSVALIWVPGHSGIPGNDKADELAGVGASQSFHGPQPVIAIATSYPNAYIQSWVSNQMRDTWRAILNCSQAKLFVKEPSYKITRALLNMSKEQLHHTVGILSGHCVLNSHLNKLGIKSEPDCDRCGHTKETAQHFLCDCPFYMKLRLKLFGSFTIPLRQYTSISISNIWKFVKRSNRFG